jgi:hypothetical protein
MLSRESGSERNRLAEAASDEDGGVALGQMPTKPNTSSGKDGFVAKSAAIEQPIL